MALLQLTALAFCLVISTGGSQGFTVEPAQSDIYVRIGGGAEFTVRPSSAIASGTWDFKWKRIVTWVGTVQVIDPQYRSRVNLNFTSGSLVLRSVSESDNGDYRVTLTAVGGGLASATITLHALERVANVSLRSNISELVEHRDSVLLTCSSQGTQLKREWLFNNQPIQQSDKINISGDTLLIDPVNRTDTGMYRCIVSNGLNNGSAETPLLVFWSLAQHVSVEQSVSGFVGTQVALRCQFVDPGKTVAVTQVSWVKDPSGAKTKLAVYNPTLGPTYPSWNRNRILFFKPSLDDATLIINPLHINDDAIYSCQFATNPESKQEGATKLTVLVRPANTGKALLVRAGDAEVAVASCESSRAHPIPTITWRSAVPHNVSMWMVPNADGTVLITGEFRAVPTSLIDGMEVECIMSQQTLEQPQIIPITLIIQYPPIVTIEGYDGDWYLNRERASITCNVKANPTADTYSWKMNGGDMPTSIRVDGHQLTVDSVSCKVNGTFTCMATNSLGTSSGSVDIVVRALSLAAVAETTSGLTPGAVAGILVGLIAACLFGGVCGWLIARKTSGPKAGTKYAANRSPRGQTTSATDAGNGPGSYENLSGNEQGITHAPARDSTYMGLKLDDQSVYSELQR